MELRFTAHLEFGWLNNCWLHTRASCVLGTYFECEGVNVPTSTLLGDHGNVRDSRKPHPKIWSSPHLRTHLTNKKWKPCARAAVPRF